MSAQFVRSIRSRHAERSGKEWRFRRAHCVCAAARRLLSGTAMKQTFRIVAAATAALTAFLVQTRPADAVLADKCHLMGDPNVRWFDPKSTVDFWITTNATLDPLAATGIPSAAFTNAVAQALNIWNEESGAAIKLRYRGFTSSTRITRAVVITGSSTVCDSAAARAFVGLVNNRYDHGTIELRKRGGQCQPIVWTTSPVGGGADLVAVLVHEIGHQVFNMDHPDGTTPDCPNFGQPSTMRNPGSRTLSNYDLELAQSRYGTRAEYGRFYYSKMTGPASWQTPVATDSTYLRPLFRPGSMGQRSNDPWFGWIYGLDNGQQNGGAGRADVNRFSFTAGSQDWRLFTTPDGALGRPVAVAYRPAGFVSSELMLAYQKVPSGSTVYSTLNGQICYRLSSNEGITWSGEVCPTGALATNYGLTASYDWHSSSFVISFVQHAPPSRVFEIGILAVPTSDSGGTPTLSFLGLSSPHGPGIACGGFINSSNCMLAYQAANSFGNLVWTKVTVQPYSRVATAGPVSTSGWAIYDTPSVIHVPADDSFRLAYAVNSSAIYSYKMPAVNGTSWAGTGDVYNVNGAQVSSPILYPHPSGDAYAWFIKYW